MNIGKNKKCDPNGHLSLPRKLIILGSGALKIGEAGEFDYSGTQAIKAIKEEGVEVVVINPNIATTQTSDYLADKVYFLPVTPDFVEKVLEKEKADAILLGFGGQTALNCGVALERAGVFERHNVRVLGTSIHSIEITEDRGLFKQAMIEIAGEVAKSRSVTTLTDAKKAADEIGYPVMVRAAYALGGLESGICANEPALVERVSAAFAHSPQVLVEECLSGWKEVEYEVVRDSYDNCITVCNMENLDPVGIHTGESIVVAPSQTLTNDEYHYLREIAIRVIRKLKIVGECNIQYALHPESKKYRIIEVNARLSRSSALASKATGYPLAFIAAKLALGYSLAELPNKITGATGACFEPALDYIVVKAPRWDLEKFRNVSPRIGSAMKSVGEVMAIARNFEEAYQKALRMLDIGVQGAIAEDRINTGQLKKELAEPTHKRAFALAAAFQHGMSLDEVHQLTRIDRWFLSRIEGLVDLAHQLKAMQGKVVPTDTLREAKRHGFSDRQIGEFIGASEDEVYTQRKKASILPRIKQIDTLAGEYPAQTNYLYLTYDAEADDVTFENDNSVLVLGTGAYRVGSSVEFDWCCVSAVHALRKHGYHTLMLNCNPETVSTDYDECDRLYFDEITFETVRAIYEREQPYGMIVSVGGQTPNNIALRCEQDGMRILGTSPLSIDNAENRKKFSALCDSIGVAQPEWTEAASLNDAKAFARKVGYPVLVRPSYVLSGAAMAVVENDSALHAVLTRAFDISPEHPTVVSKFFSGVKEIELDAVARDGDILVYAISEHVENAGVHSGDATLVLPPQRTYLETIRRARHIGAKIAKALDITGPFNIQFLAQDNLLRVIECNLRASRSFPFVSKIFNLNFIELATAAIMNRPTQKVEISLFELNYVGVKAPHFSFKRLDGADPVLGVDMASTGEVACIGDDFEDALLKALLSVGYRLPIKKVLLSTGPVHCKAAFQESAKLLDEMGIEIYGTEGTVAFLAEDGIESHVVHWPLQKESPNAMELIHNRELDLVVNIPKNISEEELTNDYRIRRAAVDYGIPLITNIQLAQRLVHSIYRKSLEMLQIKSWQDYTG